MRKTGIESIDKDTERLEALEQRSAKASGLVGKLFTLPHADGCAYYTVEEEKGRQVRVQWHDIHDAWQDNILGAGGWFSRKQIEPIIRQQEGMEKVFESARKSQDNENQKLEKSLHAAVVTDLGKNPDIYDLAHWVWERGNRGKVKDERIYKPGGRAPWAIDVADALERLKVFPAIEKVKEEYAFIRFCEGFEDPLVYKNQAPPKEAVLAKIREAFLEAVGVTPEGLDLVRPTSKTLMDTSFTVVWKAGVKIGKLWYDPKDGSVVSIRIGFEKKGNGKVKGAEEE